METPEEILQFQLNYCSTVFSDEMSSLYRRHALKAMQLYADRELASLREQLKQERNNTIDEALAEITNLKEFASWWDDDPDDEIQIRLNAGNAALDKIYKSIESLKQPQ